MKKYSIDAETSTRIFKKWIIEAQNEKQAISLFAVKIQKNIKDLKKVKCKVI